MSKYHVWAAILAAGCIPPLIANAAPDAYTCFTAPGPNGLSNGSLGHRREGTEVGNFAGRAYVFSTTPPSAGWVPLPTQQISTPADPFLLPPAPAAGPTIGYPFAYGINDSGVVVGSLSVYPWPAQSQATYWGFDQGFIWNPLTGYSLEPPWATSADPAVFAANPEFRGYFVTDFYGVGDNGLIGGEAYDPNIVTDTAGIGFIFNPTGSAINGFPPGYTTIQPTLSDGASKPEYGSGFSIVWDFNTDGWFVGGGLSAVTHREAIVWDPTGQHAHYLTSPNAIIMARSMNNGDVGSTAAANCPTAGPCYRIAGWTAAWDTSQATYSIPQRYVGYFADFDPNTGAFQQPQTVNCDQQIDPVTKLQQFPGILSWQFTGIDNDNILTGEWHDSNGIQHPLLAIPSQSLGLPVSVTANGSFVFSVAVTSATNRFFIDPRVARGYRYAIGEGNPRFGSVTLPILGYGSSYTVTVDDRRFTVAAGQTLDFRSEGYRNGVRSFVVTGIDPANALNPSNPTAFITGLTLVTAGRFTGTMTPFTHGEQDD